MDKPDGLEPIDPNQLYPLPVFRRATGLSESAMRACRRSGLVVRYLGKRGYVLGKDFISHVEAKARQSHQG